MSGPSTLRICLAAMAPALTEAASARMRLQDTSESERTSRSTKAHFGSNSCRGNKQVHSSKALSTGSNDLKVLGGRKRSKCEGQVTHLSLADRKCDLLDLQLDTNVTVSSKASGIQNLTAKIFPDTDNLSCRSRSRPSTNKTRIKTSQVVNIVPKTNIESPFYVSEDFQESSPVSEINTSLLRNLKIMNQPEIGIGKESEDNGKRENVSLLQKSNHHVERRMVNGNGEIEKKNDKNSKKCDEKGDAPPKKIPISVNKRSVHFSEVETPQAEPKLTPEKMGRPIVRTGKEFTTYSSGQILSLTRSSSPQMHSMDEFDMKSRDETRKECVRKQAYLERKVETLLRRLKRMRGKVVETHSREQLRQFVNFQHRSLQQVAKVMRSEAPGPAELKEHFLSNDEVKSMSTTDLVKLVKTYQPLASAHHRSLTSHMSDHRGISSLSKFGVPLGSSGPVIVMDSSLRGHCSDVSERLCQRVTTVSSELDSDATASSSGGESGDEEGELTITDTPGTKTKLVPDLPPLIKRAEWRWASDRSGIVSRWTWLQAQVSDLEYRIRQQSQVHRQLRASKGGVVLGEPPSTSDILRTIQGMAPAASQTKVTNPESGAGQEGDAVPPEDDGVGLEVSPCNIQAVMSNIDKQASRLTQSLGNCLSPASSSTSAPTSVVGSPRVASSTSSPGRSPAQANLRDSSPNGHPVNSSQANTATSSPSVPTELSLVSRTSDLLQNPELQRQPKTPSSLFSSSSSSLLPSSSHLDTTCQSARCRPLRSYRKRRILRTVGLYRQNHKAARLSDVRCRCAPPTNSCPMCGGRQNNTLAMDTETMPLRERIALVDSSFHPVLSFSEDVGLPIHCEGLLKSGMWQEKPVTKRSRGSHRNHHYRGSLILAGDYNLNNHKCHQNNNSISGNNHHHQGKVLPVVPGVTGPEKISKKKTKKNVATSAASSRQNNRNTAAVSSTASVIKNFSEKIKNKYESKAKTKSTGTKVKSLMPRGNKVSRKSSKVAKVVMKKKKLAVAEEEDFEALYLEQELEDIDGRGADFGGGSLSASASQSSLKDLGHQHHRSHRRRFDNSYDINNIVIPLSMATSVPVEQPQYKEIVTPKWREVPVPEFAFMPVSAEARESLTIKVEKTNGVAKPVNQLQVQAAELDSQLGDKPPGNEDGEEEEDLSDEKFALRHLKQELEEKKRFRNFVQYPPLRRSRARSDVSLSSLDTKYVDRGEGFQSEENSLSSRPTTPVLMKSLPTMNQVAGRTPSLEESLAALQQQVQGQRPRTLSVCTPSRRDTRSSSQTGQDGGEVQQDLRVGIVEAWPKRVFPLAKEEYEAMVETSDSGCRPIHQHETRYARANVSKPVARFIEPPDKELAAGDVARGTDVALDSMQSVMDSVTLSPQSASASASVSSTADDDAADPEWVGGIDAGGLSSNCTTASSSSGSLKRGRSRRILDDPNDPEWLGSDTPRKNKNKR